MRSGILDVLWTFYIYVYVNLFNKERQETLGNTMTKYISTAFIKVHTIFKWTKKTKNGKPEYSRNNLKITGQILEHGEL